MRKPRQKTESEVRKEFLCYVRGLVDYWNEVKDRTGKEKLQGLAFSILAAIDGESMLPGFILAPLPHEDDKKYYIDNGDDYYPQNHGSKVKCDIAGSLHDQFYKSK